MDDQIVVEISAWPRIPTTKVSVDKDTPTRTTAHVHDSRNTGEELPPDSQKYSCRLSGKWCLVFISKKSRQGPAVQKLGDETKLSLLGCKCDVMEPE